MRSLDDSAVDPGVAAAVSCSGFSLMDKAGTDFSLAIDLGDDMNFRVDIADGSGVSRSGTTAIVLWGPVFGDSYIKSTGGFIGVILCDNGDD